MAKGDSEYPKGRVFSAIIKNKIICIYGSYESMEYSHKAIDDILKYQTKNKAVKQSHCWFLYEILNQCEWNACEHYCD